jgi:BirA family biotin operon repressor/biotin-[acetyl-CoA-carboxylase] ligase
MKWNCILERVVETGSTNHDLLVRWRAGELIDPISRLAQNQTAGKGRNGRLWKTQANDSLCFSLAYPFEKEIQHLSGLSLICGLAVLTGISKALGISKKNLYERGLRLKWPNDLLLNHLKLGGILIEGGKLSNSTNQIEPSWMIIGVGLNLHVNTEIEKIIGHRLASLAHLISPSEKLPAADSIWLHILDSFYDYLSTMNRSGFQSFKEEWNQWDAYSACQVDIREGNSSNDKVFISGVNCGVNQEGALILSMPNTNETKLIYAGDVSLRPSI